MALISYAQNFEDIVLWRALRDVSNGRYIDIGAQDPVQDSVSKLFYDRGWRGIHAEANSYYAELIRQARPDEQVIEALVGDEGDEAVFYAVRHTGLSTGVPSIAQMHRDSGYNVERHSVASISLCQILDRFNGQPIHWMKVDVEGMEPDVLRSWREHPARPWLLSIESTAPNSQEHTHEAWIDLVQERDYTEVYFDGLSRYFLHHEHLDRRSAFASPPNVFDGYAVTRTHFSAGLLNHEREQMEGAHNAKLAERQNDLDARNAEIASLSNRQQELTDQIAAMRQELQKSDARLVNMNAEVASQRRDFLAQLVAAQAQLQLLIVEKAGLDAALTRATEQLSTEQALFDRALGQIIIEGRRRDQERSAVHERQLLELHQEVSAAFLRIEGLIAERESLISQLASLEHRLDAAEKQAGALKHEIANAHGQLASAEAKIVSLNAEVLAANDQRDMLSRDLAGRLAELDVARRLLEKQSNELSIAQSAIRTLSRSWWWKVGAYFHVGPKLELSAAAEPPQSVQHHSVGTESSMFANYIPETLPRDSHPTTLGELRAMHDEQFVRMAYRLILGREGDPAGVAHYVAEVRRGASQMRVLRGLRKSEEARSFIPGLAGLDREIARYTLGNMRGLGWLIRRFLQTDGEGIAERRLRQIQNDIGRVRYEQVYIGHELHKLISLTTQLATGGDVAAPLSGSAPSSAAAFGDSVKASMRGPLAQFFERAVWAVR